MSASACLYRRPSGIYVVRIAVPLRLRSSVGKTEIHTSTGLRDLSAAKIAALSIQLHWRNQFMALDANNTASTLLSHAVSGFIPVSEAAQQCGMSVTALLGEMINTKATLFVQAGGWSGIFMPDRHDIERDHDGSFILNDVENRGDRKICATLLCPHDSTATIGTLLAQGQCEESLFYPVNSAGVFFPDEPVIVPLPAYLMSKAEAVAISERLTLIASLQNRCDQTQAPAPAPAPAEDKRYIPGPEKHANLRFSELFVQYTESKEWGDDQARKMQKEAALFAELMDDPRLGDIDYPLILKYAGELARLPKDIYQSRRNKGLQSASARDLIAIAEDDNLPRKEEKTVKNHIGRLSEILRWAAAEANMLESNPASAYKRGWKTSQQRAQDERDLFTTDELQLIFSQEWFVNGSGKFYKSGYTLWRAHYYWIPILALTTGARLNELSQLYIDDVCKTEDGTCWYLDFNLNHSDKHDIDAQDKSLKTVNAIRVVPLCDKVIDLGLPEYITTLRQAGYKRLFPELKHDKLKGYGKPVGSWFNERFLGLQLKIERNGMKTFHSFRHTFLTAADRAGLEERVLAQIAGHIRGKTQSRMRYVKDRDALELKPHIEKIVTRDVFDVLNQIARFDFAAGLKSIASAMRRKK